MCYVPFLLTLESKMDAVRADPFKSQESLKRMDGQTI